MKLLKGEKKFILLITLTIVLIHWFGSLIGGYLYLGLCAVFIADFTLVKQKILEDRKAERILSRYNSLNVEPTYSGEA